MRTVRSILLGCLLYLLSACAAAAGPSTDLKVNMVDFAFEPNSFAVPAGQQITVELSNNGTAVHNFVIMKYGTEVVDHFTSQDEANVYWQAKLSPGTSDTFQFTAPDQPGEYQVVCSTEGHFEAGMLASLTVVAP